MIEYLDEIETEFENTLACLSGAQMGVNHEKTGDRTSRDTLPLTTKRSVSCSELLKKFQSFSPFIFTFSLLFSMLILTRSVITRLFWRCVTAGFPAPSY